MFFRGQTAEWYNRCFGHLCANQLIRIRDSFSQAIAANEGPETKVWVAPSATTATQSQVMWPNYSHLPAKQP